MIAHPGGERPFGQRWNGKEGLSTLELTLDMVGMSEVAICNLKPNSKNHVLESHRRAAQRRAHPRRVGPNRRSC